MRLVVKFAGPLRTAAGLKQAAVELEGEATTGALLRQVAKQYPGVHRELFGQDAKTYYSVFVNDRLVPENDRQVAPLKDGDQVLILLPVAGG